MLKFTQPLRNSAAGKLVTPSISDLPEFLKIVEEKWYKKLMLRFSRQSNLPSKKTRYILSMFPYPSGRLHLGHVRIYTSGDILARYSRMLARNEEYSDEFNSVIHPMGFDSFGLPAENAAKERNLNPATWTKKNIMTMKKQLDDLALQFNWREATSNPSYYKWTQEIFLRLMDANLVYKSYAKVNWDPIDQTVLADEQVDSDGKSWRSGSLVEKRYCRQWFVKTNAFTNDIYEADEVEPESWRDVLAIQRSWIGKPNGWIFYIPISDGTDQDILPIFTVRPELFLRNDINLVLCKDHWAEKVLNISEKGFIMNPFTQSQLKVIVTDDFVLPGNTNATLMTTFAANFTGLNDINQFDRVQVLQHAKLLDFGGYRTSDKYRDWLVSRQRFWGTPIPVIKCNSCGYQGVTTKELPVKLPEIDNINLSMQNDEETDSNKENNFAISTPIDKLASSEWLGVQCTSCKSNIQARRETETLDTLFDSSWYFLRYATSPPSDKPFDKDYVQPVHTYVGGLEHAAMHLFYARFICHFLHSQGDLKFREPFKKLLVQGVVKSRTYKSDGRYISKDQFDDLAAQNSDSLEVTYEKMSKSKGNGVDPEELLRTYGIDATRFCLMSYVNPRTERLWKTNAEEFKDVLLFLRRLILTVQEYSDIGSNMRDKSGNIKIKELTELELESKKKSLVDTQNNCSRKGIVHLEKTYQFRQYISVLHILINDIRNNLFTSAVYTHEFAEALASLIIMMSPITPHLSEELWYYFGKCIINPLKEFDSGSFKTILLASDQRWPIPNRIKEYPPS